MRYISELRFGLPMTYKTGSVVGSYPKPMLVLLFDRHGLEIFDKPMQALAPANLAKFCAQPAADIPPVTYIDFSVFKKADLDFRSIGFGPVPDSTGAEAIGDTINALRKMGSKIPFKTVVLDSLTEMCNVLHEHVGKIGGEKYISDARKWAGAVGGMSKNILDRFHLLQAHTVCIAHSEKMTNESGAVIGEEPMMYSKLREYLQAMFSQVIYQQHDGKNATVRVKPFGYVRGLGCKWPHHEKEVLPASFTGIYGSYNFGEENPPAEETKQQ